MSQYETDVNGKRWILVPIEPDERQIDVLRHAVIEGDLHHRQTYANVIAMANERVTGTKQLIHELWKMANEHRNNPEWISLGIRRISLSPEHVLGMLERLESGEIKGERAHRWIGWIQASLVAAGITHLGTMMSLTRNLLNPTESVDIEEPIS